MFHSTVQVGQKKTMGFNKSVKLTFGLVLLQTSSLVSVLFDLHRFPFDCQPLQINLEMGNVKKMVRFVALRERWKQRRKQRQKTLTMWSPCLIVDTPHLCRHRFTSQLHIWTRCCLWKSIYVRWQNTSLNMQQWNLLDQTPRWVNKVDCIWACHTRTNTLLTTTNLWFKWMQRTRTHKCFWCRQLLRPVPLVISPGPRVAAVLLPTTNIVGIADACSFGNLCDWSNRITGRPPW